MRVLGISKYYKIFQNKEDRRFYFEMPDRIVTLRFCELLELRGKIQNIDLDAHFSDDQHSGIEIISLCDHTHICIFTTAQIVDLQKLLFTIFETHSEADIYKKYILL